MSDPFILVRAMVLTEFRCPPMPIVGQQLEMGTDAILNSHDLMATFMAQSFKLADESKNSTRRKMQEGLRERYLRELAECDGMFGKTYDVMARHTREYMGTYLLGTPWNASDLHILPSSHITQQLANEIDHYGRALQIVVDDSIGLIRTSPPDSPVLDYGSHNVVQGLLMRCARCAVEYQEEGVVHEPVFKRMRNGVDTE